MARRDRYSTGRNIGHREADVFEPFLEVRALLLRTVPDTVQGLVHVVCEHHRVVPSERQRDLFEIVGQGLSCRDAIRERVRLVPVLHVRRLPLRGLRLGLGFGLGLRPRLGLGSRVGRERTVELLGELRVEELGLAVGGSAVADELA